MPVLGGGVAAFYLVQNGGGRLRRVAAYGLAEGASSAESFHLGEGLIGQCAQERKPIILYDITSKGATSYLDLAKELITREAAHG